MTTVTWVQDGNGNYEVSSPEHLKQLMNAGSLYTDAGSPPSSYWTTDYIQTADIDLLSDSTDIKPIGINGNTFSGDYDGGNYSISNWSYVDPNFATTDSCQPCVGFFGYANGGAVLKNIRLTGIFSLHGFNEFCGFFTGRNSGAEISNIICDFDVGTNLTRGVNTSATALYVGSFGGYSQGASITGVDVKGTIAFDVNGLGNITLGGLFGVTRFQTVSLITISATVSGLSGTTCAGLIAWMRDSTISNCINAMTGDIATSRGTAGGIIAAESAPNSITNIVNAMTGNITTSSGTAGGIIAQGQTTTTYDSLFNYMTGDISGTNSGGIFGGAASPSTVTNSINAMNGNVENSVRGTGTVSGSVTVDTNFGLTFTSNDNGTSTPLAGFLTIASFPDLPYFLLSGSDTVGNTYDYDFIFANIGGNNTYSTTHLIISGGVGTFQDGVVPIPPLVVTPRVSSVLATVTPVTGAIAYRLTSQDTGSLNENVVKNNFTDLVQRISSLSPSTEYTFRLYSTTGSGFVLEYTETVTTLENSASNYDTSVYGTNGKFDLTVLDDSSFALLGEVMNEVFTTGEELEINIGPRKSKVAFVKRGEAVSTDDSILVPFSTSGGSGQEITMNLSDASTVSVAYDEVNGALTIGTETLEVGDSTVVDGKKLTVKEL